MAEQDEPVVLLRYAVDTGSVTQAVQSNQTVADSLTQVGVRAQSVADQLAELGVQGQQIFLGGEDITATLVTPFDAADTSVKTLIRDIGDLGRDIESIPEPALGAFGVDEGSGGGGGIGVGGARGALRASAGLLGADAGGPVARSASQALVLVSSFGLAGAAAAVFELGLRAVTAGQQEAAKTAQDYASELGSIGTKTTADIQTNIDGLNAQKAAYTEGRGILEGYQAKLDDLNKEYGNSLIGFNGINPALNDLNEEIYKATGGAYGLKDGIGNVVVNSGMLNGALDENQKSLDKVNAEIASNTTALDSQAVAANTAAAALKQFSDGQVKAAQRDIEINNLTAAQRDEKAKQDMADYDSLQKRIEAGGLTEQAAIALRAQEQGLLADYNKLTAATNTYADQLERVAAATDKNQNYLDALAKEGEARAALFQTEQDIAAVEVKTTQDVVAVEAKAADERVQAAQDTAAAVSKIERDAGRQLFKDKAERDAVAYVQAQQTEADNLDDQVKALSKKDAAIDKSEQAQLQTITTAEHQKLEVLTAVHSQELVDVQNTGVALVALSYEGALGVVNAHEYMWQAVEATAVRGIHSLINAISTQFGLGVNETPGGSGTPFANAVNGIVDSRINQTLYGGYNGASGNNLR